jgi:hypothetical protein
LAKATTKSSSSSEEAVVTKLDRCLVPLKHDGVAYEIGDKVDLTENQAKALLSCKAIEVGKSAPAKGEEK